MLLVLLQAIPDIPDKVPTTVIGIVGLIVVIAGWMLRGWLVLVAENQKAEIEQRKQDAMARVEESKANRAILLQVVGFMQALNENMRALPGIHENMRNLQAFNESMRVMYADVIRSALREPLVVKIDQGGQPVIIKPQVEESKP